MTLSLCSVAVESKPEKRLLWALALEFEPRDLWMGIYWNRQYLSFGHWPRMIHIWICLVPMFPLHIRIPRYGPRDGLNYVGG